MFNTLGTPNNLAIWDYLNQQKVPQLYVATGASDWGTDIKAHPYTIGWQPNYVTEAKVYADYLKNEKPNAKVAVLYQNDGFGKDLLGGFKEGIAGSGIKIVKAGDLRRHRPDGRGAGRQARALGRRHVPEHHDAEVRRAGASRRSPRAAGSRCTSSTTSARTRTSCSSRSGWRTPRASISTSYFKDPQDPQWADDAGDEGVQGRDEAVRAQGRPRGRLQHVRLDGGDHDGQGARADEEADARRADGRRAEHDASSRARCCPGEKIETSPDDGYPLEAMQIIKFDGQNWKLQGDLIQAKAD